MEEDYGERWYDVFAKDVVKVADKLHIDKFFYMGASHGAGVGWHLMLLAPSRVKGFVACVPGPHSLAEGSMSMRQMVLSGIKEPPPIDYGRPLLKFKTEEKLCEALRTIEVPTLILGAIDDPISTPELMIRSAKALPHCKMILYSNCGHNIDTDLVEELSGEADRFMKQVDHDGRVYAWDM